MRAIGTHEQLDVRPVAVDVLLLNASAPLAVESDYPVYTYRGG